MRALDLAHQFYTKQAVWRAWVRFGKLKKKTKLKKSHVADFYNRGLAQRAMKYWKQYAHMFGKELLAERLEMSVQNRVHADIESKRGE